MLWGSVHSRDFYPVTLVTGLHTYDRDAGPHSKDSLLGVLRGSALIPVVRASGGRRYTQPGSNTRTHINTALFTVSAGRGYECLEHSQEAEAQGHAISSRSTLELEPRQSLFFFLFLIFRPCHTACGILVPRAGLKPTTLCVGSIESKPLDHRGNPRQVSLFPNVPSNHMLLLQPIQGHIFIPAIPTPSHGGNNVVTSTACGLS